MHSILILIDFENVFPLVLCQHFSRFASASPIINHDSMICLCVTHSQTKKKVENQKKLELSNDSFPKLMKSNVCYLFQTRKLSPQASSRPKEVTGTNGPIQWPHFLTTHTHTHPYFPPGSPPLNLRIKKLLDPFDVSHKFSSACAPECLQPRCKTLELQQRR